MSIFSRHAKPRCMTVGQGPVKNAQDRPSTCDNAAVLLHTCWLSSACYWSLGHDMCHCQNLHSVYTFQLLFCIR